MVYKNEEDVKQILRNKSNNALQQKVNKLCKKVIKIQAGFNNANANQSDSDADEDEDEGKDQHTLKMEDGGFTVVSPEKDPS